MQPSLLRFALAVLGRSRNASLSIVAGRHYTLITYAKSSPRVLPVAPLLVMDKRARKKASEPQARNEGMGNKYGTRSATSGTCKEQEVEKLRRK